MPELYMAVVIGLAICAAFGYWLLADSGRGASGAVLGIFLGPIGVVVAAILRGQPPSVSAIPSSPSPPFSASGTAPVRSGHEVTCWNCHRVYDRSLDKCPHCGKRAAKL